MTTDRLMPPATVPIVADLLTRRTRTADALADLSKPGADAVYLDRPTIYQLSPEPPPDVTWAALTGKRVDLLREALKTEVEYLTAELKKRGVGP